ANRHAASTAGRTLRRTQRLRKPLQGPGSAIQASGRCLRQAQDVGVLLPIINQGEDTEGGKVTEATIRSVAGESSRSSGVSEGRTGSRLRVEQVDRVSADPADDAVESVIISQPWIGGLQEWFTALQSGIPNFHSVFLFACKTKSLGLATAELDEKHSF